MFNKKKMPILCSRSIRYVYFFTTMWWSACMRSSTMSVPFMSMSMATHFFWQGHDNDNFISEHRTKKWCIQWVSMWQGVFVYEYIRWWMSLGCATFTYENCPWNWKWKTIMTASNNMLTDNIYFTLQINRNHPRILFFD